LHPTPRNHPARPLPRGPDLDSEEGVGSAAGESRSAHDDRGALIAEYTENGPIPPQDDDSVQTKATRAERSAVVRPAQTHLDDIDVPEDPPIPREGRGPGGDVGMVGEGAPSHPYPMGLRGVSTAE